MSIETMRAALDWCETRGLSPTMVSHHPAGHVTVDFHTRGRDEFESREAFVALCRQAGVLNVESYSGFVCASSIVDGFEVKVYSGNWTTGRLLDRLASELETELRTVYVGGAA